VIPSITICSLLSRLVALISFAAVVVIDFATKRDFFVHTFDNEELFDLTSGFSLFVIAYTNEFGDPVELPNDGPSNGYNRIGTVLDFIPNIAYGSMNYVENLADQCDYTKYESELRLTEQQIVNIGNETDLNKALSYDVRIRRFSLPHVCNSNSLFLSFSLSAVRCGDIQQCQCAILMRECGRDCYDLRSRNSRTH
jgi:hypothetical protein